MGDRVVDRDDGERRAHAVAATVRPVASPAAIGKPFERVADACPVDTARADTPQRRPEIEQRQRIGDRVQAPGDGDEGAARERDRQGAEPVDEPALERHQPGLAQDEDREGDLNGGASPFVLGVDRMHEQRPAMLQAGDHHHAGDAGQELDPAIMENARHGRRCSGASSRNWHGLDIGAAGFHWKDGTTWDAVGPCNHPADRN
jgi:hypothetical protein